MIKVRTKHEIIYQHLDRYEFWNSEKTHIIFYVGKGDDKYFVLPISEILCIEKY